MIGWLCGATPALAETPRPEVYDPLRDPETDTRIARDRARETGRHVLLVVGSDDCIWCFWLNRHLDRDPAAMQALRSSFEVVHVYYGDAAHNQAFFDQLPEFQRFPHLYVMDVNGAVLDSRDAAVLMKAGKFDTARISEFAANWPAEAEVAPSLGAAMTQENEHVPG